MLLVDSSKLQFFFLLLLLLLLTIGRANGDEEEVAGQDDDGGNLDDDDVSLDLDDMFASGILGQTGNASSPVNAKEGAWPFMASIWESNKHACSGTVLNDNTILTSTGCIHSIQEVRNVRIYVGQTNVNGDERSALKVNVNCFELMFVLMIIS